MIYLTHYDDGKEKFQSHEVFMKEGKDLYDIDFCECYGYGEDYEEALENFKTNFSKKMEKLLSFREKLMNNDKEIQIIEVGCLGEPINPLK